MNIRLNSIVEEVKLVVKDLNEKINIVKGNLSREEFEKTEHPLYFESSIYEHILDVLQEDKTVEEKVEELNRIKKFIKVDDRLLYRYEYTSETEKHAKLAQIEASAAAWPLLEKWIEKIK